MLTGDLLNKPSVYIVGNDVPIRDMFYNRGFSIVNSEVAANIVVYGGGADLNPELYGQRMGPKMKPIMMDYVADARDLASFKRVNNKQMKIGICRGGQFLNIMNEGIMIQHVNNHVNSHPIIDTLFGEDKTITVTSTHHQMMVPSDSAEVLAYSEGVATEYWGDKGQIDKPALEPEVLWYERTRSLCFQPHPEMSSSRGGPDTQDYFFDIIELLR